MTGVLLLAALQASALPTVGDTVWLETRVPLQPRQILRAQTWELGEIGRVLGPPVVELGPDSAVVRYPVAFWFPGRHAVAVPGPIVVNPEGRSDTLDARRLQIEVASVLPPEVRRDTVPPRPAADLIRQAARSPLPLAVLWTLLALVALAVWRVVAARRRPRADVPAPKPAAPDLRPLLVRWADAGELRTAADGWAHLVAGAAGASPTEESTALLEELDRIGFRPDARPEEVEAVIARARRWLDGGRR